MLNDDWLRSLLPGRTIVHLERPASTMIEATGLAQRSAPHGTLVIADEQTAGQGRHGHSWHSEPGAGLYMSLVLRPMFPIEATPALTIAIGLATRRAILETTGLACDLRWPNDLMYADRKLGGILVQMAPQCAIAGIGVNTGHTCFPAALSALATSLRQATGGLVAREPLAAAVAMMVDDDCERIAASGVAPVIEEFQVVSTWAIGKRVLVEQQGEIVRGVTAGLDQHGFLRVQADDGHVTTILAGGVRSA